MSNDQIKVFVVEDMAISRISLENMLEKNNYKVVGSAAKAETAWEKIKNTSLDLLLLDINLAGEQNGIWLAKKVREKLNISIIYLTAYGDQKTLKEVIETKPDGYLMKPYQEPTLLTTITIAIQHFLDNQKDAHSSESGTILKDIIYIKDRYIKVKLNLKEIIFIKSDGNYLEVYLENKTHVVRSKLSEFQKLLSSDLFHQTHQRYLVNIKKVDVIGKDFLTIGQTDIPISSKYKKDLESVLPIL